MKISLTVEGTQSKNNSNVFFKLEYVQATSGLNTTNKMLWYKSLQHMTKYQWTESEFFHRSWMQTLTMIKRIFNFNDGPNVKNNISNSNSNLSNFTKENPDNSVVNF